MTSTISASDAASVASDTVLQIEHLRLDLAGRPSQAGLIDDVTFDVRASETVALIGESGCGKSITALAVLGLLPPAITVASGSIRLGGEEVADADAKRFAELRGSVVGTVFQDPMSSLDPTMTIGRQIAEPRRVHLDESKRASMERAIELLDLVGIPNPRARANAYPFQLSGGMQQRALIAAAVACEPKFLIADEPTTALDVTVQAEILELLEELQGRTGMGILFVTHDLGVVADIADRVVVMYAGHVVERATTHDLFEHPSHPYTKALLSSVPQAGRAREQLAVIAGRVPPAGAFPRGCRFQDRCSYTIPDVCSAPVDLVRVCDDHWSRCVHAVPTTRTERTL